MEAVLPILGAILIVWLLSRVNHSDDDQADSYVEENIKDDQSSKISPDNPLATINVQTKNAMNDNEYEGMDVPTLIKALLAKMNCQYDENDDGSLFFTYQGERFWLTSNKESAWIRIIDLQWYDCPLDNLEEISCMQKAINTANSGQSCTAIYVISKEDNKMIVYSKCDLLIFSHFPAPDQYLATWLACFFRLKQEVVMEFEKEKQKIGLNVD